MSDKRIYIAIIIALTALVGWYYYRDQSISDQYGNRGRNRNIQTMDKQPSPNRGNCLADECLAVDNLEYPAAELPDNVAKALVTALQDEYKALTVYQAVTDKLGMVRPFSMIIRAEEQHISALKSLFDKYGIDIPTNEWSKKISAPATLSEACQAGVDAEIANAALYRDQLLPVAAGYTDISGVFTNLMNASQDKHLPAFERCN